MRIDVLGMETSAVVISPSPVSSFALIPGSGCRVDEHPAAVYLASLRESGRRTMRQALRRALEVLVGQPVDPLAFDWSGLRFQHVAALRTALAESGMKPATTNKILAAVRGVCREAWRLGQLDGEAFARIRDVKGLRFQALPKGRALEAAELGKLREACADGSPIGSRDVALLAVLFSGGLRRAELVALDVEAWDSARGVLRIEAGKGGKDRLVFLRNGARSALEAWLEVRRAELGTDAGPLFVSARHRALTASRLTADGIFEFLRRAAARANVEPFAPHDCRRTCISAMLEAGADLFSAQRHAGHASPTTTARYDRRDERAQERAASSLHFPL